MKAFGEQFMMMGSMMEIIEVSDEAIHFKALRCPYAEVGRDPENNVGELFKLM